MKAKSLLHRVGIALLVLVLLAANSFAYAAELPDLTQKGQISITLRDSKTGAAVSGGELTLYPVASVSVQNGRMVYTYINGFEDCGIPLDNVEDSELAGRLQAKLSASASGTSQTVGSAGGVRYTGLAAGLYLIVQTERAAGYRTINSFMASLPMKIDGSWTYYIDASPKVSTSTSSKPSEPDKPDTPPDTPEPPDTPDEPETPPDKPVTPNKPNKPSHPGKPDDLTDISEDDTPLGWRDGTPDALGKPGASSGSGKTSGSNKRLPQTGQLNWPIPVLCIGGLVLFSCGWLIRKDEHDR